MKENQDVNDISSLKVIDLFAGCGGLSLGFQNVGFNIVAAFDNWNPAIAVYQENFSHPIFNYNLDVEDFSIFHKFNPDLIVGGPPCQDFSSAGKRDEELGRGDLTITFAKIIASVKPRWFVMENVARIVSSEKYKLARSIFKDAGYGLTEKKLDASLCGVPQKRVRFFCIGKFAGEDDSLKDYLEKNLSQRPITVKEYLEEIDIQHYYRHPRSYKRRGVFSIDEPSATIRGVNRPIPKNYKPHPGDTALIENLRSLTTIERSYIQTFPKDFIFKGSKTDLEQMIGNAVPVKLAEFVAHCLAEYMQENTNQYRENQPLQLSLALPNVQFYVNKSWD